MADVQFDEDAVRRHVAMLHERARGVVGELVLAVYGEDPETGQRLAQVYRHPVGDVDGMVASAMGLEKVRHANLYMPLHVVRGGLRDGARGTTSDIVAVLGLVADMDADTGHCGEMPVEASLVIETSPGNAQPVILFDRPISASKAKPLAVALKNATGADSGTADIAHVWRLPGSHNWPNAKKLARGRSRTPAPVRVVKEWDGSLQSCEALAEVLRPWRPAPPVVTPLERSWLEEDGAALPPKLFELIRDGVEVGERSQEFMHAVGWLKDLGYQPDAIEELLAANPTGIAEKYDSGGRLRQEIDRCYGKTRSRSANAFADVQPNDKGTSQGSLLLWYGDKPPQPPPWLVQNTLPETGVALLAGQYGTGKTFVAFDLTASVLTGADFMGQQVCRRGGVLWLAAEGEAEVEARLAGVIDGKLRATLGEGVELDHLAFARQKFEVPRLGEKDAQTRLAQLAKEACEGMLERFGVPLALILIDTLAAAAAFDDENSAGETQRVMEVLKRFSRFTGALVVAVDHYGKTTDSGPRGSTAKGAASDAMLSVLADKIPEGDHKNRRLVVSKLRSGPSGRVVPFDLRQIPILGTSETTCVVEWRLDNIKQDNVTTAGKSVLSPRTRIFKSSMDTALRAASEIVYPYSEPNLEVSAVEREKVRQEYYSSLSGTIGAKRKAFTRAQEDATGRGLIMSREIGGRDMLWFKADVRSEPQRDRRDSPYGACPVRPGAEEDKQDKCPPCPPCPGAEVRDESPCGVSTGAAGG